MFDPSPAQNRRNTPGVQSANRDLLTGGILTAAIILFVGNGSEVIPPLGQSLFAFGAGAEQVATTALLLNVALILFGWRRYSDLRKEVAQRTVTEERAVELSNTDPLTSVLNRRALVQRAPALIGDALDAGRGIAVFVIDLNRFKSVNDLYGHSIGDDVLGTVSRLILANMPADALCARLGGDEFAVVLSYSRGATDEATDKAQAIVTGISAPLRVGGLVANIGASVGIARAEPDCTSIDALLRRADIAMYVAKRANASTAVWFDTGMEEELRFRNEIEAGLREGIAGGQFVPFFEQQIDLATGRLQGFEVLARWDHPEKGLVSPSVFIPIAEASGLIGELSETIIRQAMIEAREWDPSLTLSVNISPAQLKDPLLAHKVLKLLTETGFPAHRLEVEITESSLFENLELAKVIATSLKNQGIKLSLDDFGTGYSSLSHLRALPFDKIKIDRSFVQSLSGNLESDAIVRSIAKLAEGLGVPVTAEGIETAEMQDIVRALGCQKGQGWHFGKPLSGEETRALLDRVSAADAGHDAAQASGR